MQFTGDTLIDGIPVHAIAALLTSVRSLGELMFCLPATQTLSAPAGASSSQVVTSTDATASGAWNPPKIVTTTTISFDFQAVLNGPDRPPSRAVTVSSDGSVEYLEAPARDDPPSGERITSADQPLRSIATPIPVASPSFREAAVRTTANAEEAGDVLGTTSGQLTSAIGPPGLTPAATQRWYVITAGTNVGVFQGWYVFFQKCRLLTNNTSNAGKPPVSMWRGSAEISWWCIPIVIMQWVLSPLH